MRDAQLAALVTQAVATDREVCNLNDMLKGMKAQLVAEARSREDEHVTTDGGGWSVTFHGVDGCVARVTTPADALKPAIDGEGKAIEQVRTAAGPHFARLFEQAPKWRLIPNFRAEAASLLGRSAARLIRLCTKESHPSVAFETKQEDPS